MFKNHLFSWAALESFLLTFVGFLAFDASVSIERFISGGFSRDAVVGLLVAVARSLVKYLWVSLKNTVEAQKGQELAK